MDTRHTPGPWRVEDPMAPRTVSVVVDDETEVYDWTFIADCSGPKAWANARLIAAAPALYTALSDLMRVMDDESKHDEFCAARGRAAAALNAANGE